MKKLKPILQYNKLLIISIIFIICYVLLFTKVIKYNTSLDLNSSILSGKVTSISLNSNKLTLTIKTKEKVIVNYYLNSKEEKESILDEISLGDSISLEGTFKVPSNNTIPNTFNYKNYLYNKKIYTTFTASSYQVIKENHNPFYYLKDTLLKRCYHLENSDYFLIFILGDKSLLDTNTLNAYQTNGISHLLAVSGMHIGVLLSIINIFLKKLNSKKQFIITSIILIIFLFLTSATASVLRAVIFFILLNLNKIFNLKLSSLKVLYLTGFIILIFNPFMIYDLGFIYSFIVCFGIIYYQDKIKGNYFTSLLKLSIITFLFSFPISAITNYEVNILSILLNLIFVPLISLVVYPFGLITFILPILNPLFSFILSITNTLTIYLSKFNMFINIPKTSIIFIIIIYLLLLKGKSNYRYFLLIIPIILIIKVIPHLDTSYHIYYLDVGQGDSSVLISPHKKEVIMIDTGGEVTYGKEDWQVSSKVYNLSDDSIKFLKSLGITHLDYLIISHGDADHSGEASHIIDKIKVKRLILNSGEYNDIEKNIASLVPVVNNYNLKYFNIMNLNNNLYDNENDNSIVNYIKIYNYQFLFMGDASIKVEADILNKYKLSNIDFLKVGHHGSNTSSSTNFINSINTKYSIISVGLNNRYNHPKESVLNILSSTNIYRTDLNGSIEIILNKNKYKITTYSP